MPEEVKYTMTLTDLVSGKLEQADHQAKKFEGTLGTLHEGLRNLGERAIRVGETLGISFGIYKIAEFYHESVEYAHQLGQADAQLKAGIISTNGAAGVSYEELEVSAKKFESTLPFTRAQIVDMQSQIITFPGITKRIFDEASVAVMNMSTRLHKGLDETAIMVGKALQDPERGITAMRRVGVNFNSTQTEIIKNLVKTGHVAKAQTMILKELSNEFAGSAKAAADADPLFRYNKIMSSIKLEVGEAGEALLHELTPALQTMALTIKGGIEELKELWHWGKENKILLRDIAIVVGSTTAAYLIYQGVLKAGIILESLSTTYKIASATASELLLAWDMARAEGMGVLTAAQWALNVAMDANPIGIIIVAVGAFVGAIVVAYKHSETFRAVLSGIGEAATSLIPIFKGLAEVITGAMTLNWSLVKKGFNDTIDASKGIGKAFWHGYNESMAESHETTMAKIAKKENDKKKLAPGATPMGMPKGSTSKVTGTKVTNIHITIGKLSDITIKTTNIKEGYEKIKDEVTKVLLAAVNDSQLVVGS
jgi:hypothetical protein